MKHVCRIERERPINDVKTTEVVYYVTSLSRSKANAATLLVLVSNQREALRQLFDDRSLTTTAAGSLRLTEWLTTARALGLSALNKFCDTLQRWQDKIANYFVSRSSNGPTEGFNNGLRTILRRTFGMHNFRHFRLRVLDRFGTPQPQEST